MLEVRVSALGLLYHRCRYRYRNEKHPCMCCNNAMQPHERAPVPGAVRECVLARSYDSVLYVPIGFPKMMRKGAKYRRPAERAVGFLDGARGLAVQLCSLRPCSRQNSKTLASSRRRAQRAVDFLARKISSCRALVMSQSQARPRAVHRVAVKLVPR